MEKKIKPANLKYCIDKVRGSQRKLADALGLSTSFISQCKVEGGSKMPIEYLPTICAILKCTEEDLCDKYVVNKGEHTKVVKLIIEKIDTLDEKQQVELYADIVSKYF